MSYQVLARKWRPQDFASLIGQEPIVTALRNALTEGRIAQAYLFSGIRGVGKTTAARVLAKALNCERGPAGDPCNECDSCQQITAGNEMDVVEVDAATYSKVEQVRELTESLRYGPARGRYKIVVLDEVHRLSRQAFDALLKIVEEPPAHLIFVFATTEIDAVPATILSRCQEFQFRRVPSSVLSAHLRNLCDKEQITASDAALRLIARAGEGSVRDSIALLDQLATFGSGTIDDQQARDLLGGLDSAVFHRLLAAILGAQHSEVVAVVREIEDQGWDPHHVYGQFLGYVRDALHLALGGSSESVDLPAEEADSLLELARPAGTQNLLRLSQLLLNGEPTVRRSEFAAVALEILWLRAAELPKLTGIEALLTGRAEPPVALPQTGIPSSHTAPPQAATPASPRNTATGSTRAQTGNSRAEAKPAPRQTESESVAKTSAATPATPHQESPAAAGPAPAPEQLLQQLASSRRSLVGALGAARLSFVGHELLIEPPDGDVLIAQALDRSVNAKALAETLAQLWTPQASWRLVEPGHHGAPEPASPSDGPAGDSSGLSEAASSTAGAPPPLSGKDGPKAKAASHKPASDNTEGSKNTSPPAGDQTDLRGETTSDADDGSAVQAVLDIFDGQIESKQAAPRES